MTEPILPCWTFTYEADGFDNPIDWITRNKDTWEPRYKDVADPDHPNSYAIFDDAEAMCILDEGHAGPHEFRRQSEIGMVFR